MRSCQIGRTGLRGPREHASASAETRVVRAVHRRLSEMFPRRLVFFFALVLDASFVCAVADAQTVTASSQRYPVRLLPNGMNACGGPATDASCVSTRPPNLTPLGISYEDCIDDQTLEFTVVLSGFDGSQNLQVWASTSSDCTAPTDRGTLGAAAAVCWKVSANLVGPILESPSAYSFRVRVEDLVGWQQHPPFPVPAGVETVGQEGCMAQPTFAAVALKVNFVPVDTSGSYTGTSYQYAIDTDLVGPPAPGGLHVEAGNGELFPSWTPNTDKDTAGYDVFLAPPPGQPQTGQGCPPIPGANDAGTPGAGGISSVPADYVVGVSNGMTVTGESTAGYLITNQADETTYAVAVAAVDAMGNVGPTSPPICAVPAADAGFIDAGLEDDAGQTGAGDDGGAMTVKAGCLCSHGAPATPEDAPSLVAAGAIAIALARRRRGAA